MCDQNCNNKTKQNFYCDNNIFHRFFQENLQFLDENSNCNPFLLTNYRLRP